MSSVPERRPDLQSGDLDDRDLHVRLAAGLDGISTRHLKIRGTHDEFGTWLFNLIQGATQRRDDEIMALFPPLPATNPTHFLSPVVTREHGDPHATSLASEYIGLKAPGANQTYWYLWTLIEDDPLPPEALGIELAPGDVPEPASQTYMACRMAAESVVDGQFVARLDYLTEVELWITVLVSRAESGIGAVEISHGVDSTSETGDREDSNSFERDQFLWHAAVTYQSIADELRGRSLPGQESLAAKMGFSELSTFRDRRRRLGFSRWDDLEVAIQELIRDTAPDILRAAVERLRETQTHQ